MTPRSIRRVRQLASLCCAASVGALLFSVRVATTVFQELPGDRALAGRIAGRSFTGAYAISAVAAIVAVAVVITTRSRRRLVDGWCACSFVIAAALELGWIAPAIGAHGAGWPGSFASLHAAGGALHVFMAVLALVLAWRLLDDEVDRPAVVAQRF